MIRIPNKRQRLRGRTLLAVLTVSSLALSVGGAAQQEALPGGGSGSAPASTQSSLAAARDFRITPDDLLEVTILDVPELSRVYRVSPSGTIAMPLLGQPLVAAGKTPSQLSAMIANELRSAELVSYPQVTVEVRESRLHAVAVTGAVKKPQIYPVFGRTTLLDVLSQAEGLAPDAGNTLVLTRGDVAVRLLAGEVATGEPSPPTVTVDLRRLMDTGDPALNFEVLPGDRVTVQRAGIVYVVGAVNRPGGFPLSDDQEEITVLKAVALAQDLKTTAVRHKAVIIRKNPQSPQSREEIPVDLKRVLAGKTADPPMRPSDILFVPESVGKKAVTRMAEAAIQATVGIIIWRR